MKAPCALGKAGVPARKDFYLMPDYVHPASPTAIGLLKNLTEKIGAHTLFYDQKKQSKTTANNRHSFCRFCASAIWWSPRRRSNETAPRSGTTCLHNVVNKCIYGRSLNRRNKSRGTALSPRRVGTAAVFSEVSVRPRCCGQSQGTSGAEAARARPRLSCPGTPLPSEIHFAFMYAAPFQRI